MNLSQDIFYERPARLANFGFEPSTSSCGSAEGMAKVKQKSTTKVVDAGNPVVNQPQYCRKSQMAGKPSPVMAVVAFGESHIIHNLECDLANLHFKEGLIFIEKRGRCKVRCSSFKMF